METIDSSKLSDEQLHAIVDGHRPRRPVKYRLKSKTGVWFYRIVNPDNTFVDYNLSDLQ